MTVLDHTQDVSGAETHRLTQLHEPPQFVKEADHSRLHGDPDVLPASVYGDQASRTWPLHSAPAVWMSSLFFFDKKAELSPLKAEAIEKRIMDSARYLNILPHIEKLKKESEAHAAHDLARCPDSDFALVWESEAGKERHYPIRNAAEVKMASAWFAKFKDEFVWGDRRRIAEKIHEKAATYGVLLDNQEAIEKTAGFGACPGEEVVQALQHRANMCARSHPAEAAEMRKLADAVGARPSCARDHAIRDKLAAAMDQYDRATKLTRLYDEGGLERPEEVLFKLTSKTASDFVDEHVHTPSGAVYEKAALAGVPLEHVRQWMGSDFADEVAAGGLYTDPEKIAEIAPTLPKGDAEMLERMLRAAGVTAFARTKASYDQGLSKEEMLALAEEYDG